MAQRTEPKLTDSKYLLPNGQYDHDAFTEDLNKWQMANLAETAQRVTRENGNPRPQRQTPIAVPVPVTSRNEANRSSDGAGPGHYTVPDDILTEEAIINAPRADGLGGIIPPSKETTEDAAKAGSSNDPAGTGGNAPKKDRPWYETDVDAIDTATGTVQGGGGAKLPDWATGEVQNFRYADQKRLEKMYADGVKDTDFRGAVHDARQNRHGEGGYAHGYDYADKDRVDDDPRSRENAAFFEDESWVEEVESMEPAARKEYMRALQAADPESALAILEDDRRKRQTA